MPLIPEGENEIQVYKKRFQTLREDQSSWRSHWADIAEYTLPRKGRYLTSLNPKDKRDGNKRHQRIINGTGGDALKVLAAGMQGGMTSPSRPWFVLSIKDKDLLEFTPVRQWLTDVRDIVLGIYGRSNFYGSMHNIYKELGAFGVASHLQEEDFKTTVRFRPFTIGEYMLSLDESYRPSSLYRQFTLTAQQMYKRFDYELLSDAVRTSLESNNIFEEFIVNHIIEPNENTTDVALGIEGMQYQSLYFEEHSDAEVFLRRRGYQELPFIAPRWDITSTDTYGTCPAMESLGDIKMLQKMEEKSLKALDKIVDPPMNADPSLKGKGGSIVPGHINYISTQNSTMGFQPAYQINPDLQKVEFKIDRVEQRIKRFFFNDLFLMIVNDQRSSTTAYEISKKYEEKLLMLGPVIERIQSESHDPTIERTFQIAERNGLLPPPPPELQGHDLKVEYISILAQAQKMVGTTSIEQTTGFIGNLVAVQPEALDKLDIDQTIDEYAQLTGAPPKMIRSDDDVAKIRQQRAEAQQRQQQAEQAANMVQGAKTLSDTKVDEGNALDRIISSQQEQQGIQ